MWRRSASNGWVSVRRHDRPMKIRLETTLKALRRRKGWSQARLGQALGASQQRMSRFEADVRRASLGLLDTWATELGAY
ncbi:MAG: helix-turn-helix transcriptional regulator, partial [Candidatus Limnocylindria bacterium]